MFVSLKRLDIDAIAPSIGGRLFTDPELVRCT